MAVRSNKRTVFLLFIDCKMQLWYYFVIINNLEMLRNSRIVSVQIRSREEQMETRYYMVIIKGEIKTSEIMSCVYNKDTQKWDVKFNNVICFIS